MDVGTVLLAFLAGVILILSPCVLPLVPVVVATALSKHRFGVVALAAGLALAFTAIGLFVALIGFSIGLDESVIRPAGAILLMVVGVVLMVPQFQAQFALAAGPVGGWMEGRFGGQTGDGFAGQFGVGMLLGAVWAPCAGPTLGAAVTLAAQGRDLLQVTATMLAFSIGTVLPLAVLGLMSRSALARWREKMLTTGTTGKIVLGGILVANGALILSGWDKMFQAALVDVLPVWLLELIARY